MIPVQATALSSTFDFWRNRTNDMANSFSTCVVTTDANTGSQTTPGNAAITGTFSANVLVAGNTSANILANSTTLSFSNSLLTMNVTLPTVAQFYSTYILASNGQWTYNPMSNGELLLLGNNIKKIDEWTKSQFSGVEYLLTVKDNAANNYYATKVMVTHDSNTAFMTEYAAFTSNSYIGVFTTDSNTTHIRLWFTPTSVNNTVKYVRMAI